MKSINEILNYRHHSLQQEPSVFYDCDESSKQQLVHKNGVLYIIGEFWTSKQRQASSIHEVSYRACFKPQLPNFFIDLYSEKGDVVYDPFSGRGTTAIEAALCGREVIANDINPLSKILASPRIMIPRYEEFETRLESIPYAKNR
ncbi:MAG TPA: DNA methyltransferase, partial [Candidatus Cloacimonadota bacterium]|nr:DNA methyltransferase [Candidatus Cloacimonadota bacterium]